MLSFAGGAYAVAEVVTLPKSQLFLVPRGHVDCIVGLFLYYVDIHPCQNDALYHRHEFPRPQDVGLPDLLPRDLGISSPSLLQTRRERNMSSDYFNVNQRPTCDGDRRDAFHDCDYCGDKTGR